MGQRFYKWLFEYEVPVPLNSYGNGSAMRISPVGWVCDTLEETIDLKIASLKKHKSEYNKFGGEDWINGVKCRCGFRGYEIGKKYAEAFEMLRLEMNFDKKTSL